jgi:hypothetical protein
MSRRILALLAVIVGALTGANAVRTGIDDDEAP